MSFYPSLEDLEVDHIAKAQIETAQVRQAIQQTQTSHHSAPQSQGFYSSLLQDFLPNDYLGIDVSEQALATQISQEVAIPQPSSLPGAHAIASITPKNDIHMARAEIKQGVKQIILAKDGSGKVGFAVKSIDKGIFVCFVWQGSAASLGGLRFGDQILQINGESVAGWTEKQVLKFVEKADAHRIAIAVRERPWCRTITMIKDSVGHVGFTFRNGEINNIVKDSSAARNGMLIHHQLVEVNGANVVGMKDKDITAVFAGPTSMTITIMPAFIFKHLMKKMPMSVVRQYQEHGVPDV